MEVQLTAEQEAFIREAIESGRYESAEAAVSDALRVWEEDERWRRDLLAGLAESEADIEAGRYTEYTDETLPQLIEELKREAREYRDRGES